MRKRSKNDEMSPLRATCIQLHEMFTELKAAGFSRKEAIHLIGMMITHGIAEGMEEEEGNS